MTKPAAALLAAEEFERVANTTRWSTRSLAVAKAIHVHGRKPVEAAKLHEMTADQARVIGRRFLAKAEALGKKKLTAEDFMQAVKPEGFAALEPFRKELQQLRRNRYTDDQLILFLSENGVQTTLATLDQFLPKANK